MANQLTESQLKLRKILGKNPIMICRMLTGDFYSS